MFLGARVLHAFNDSLLLIVSFQAKWEKRERPICERCNKEEASITLIPAHKQIIIINTWKHIYMYVCMYVCLFTNTIRMQAVKKMPHEIDGLWKLTCESCIPKIAEDIENAKKAKEQLAITAGLELAAKLQVDTRIECRYDGGRDYFPGKISAIHAETKTFDIAYDDGDSEKNVPPHFIRLA